MKSFFLFTLCCWAVLAQAQQNFQALAIGQLQEGIIKRKFRKQPKFEETKPLHQPGKIYTLNTMLYINDKARGLHLVDNSNPATPRFVSFVDIPGNMDVALNNGILYADSYADLLVINLSNRETKRINNVFTESFVRLHPEAAKKSKAAPNTLSLNGSNNAVSPNAGGVGTAKGGSMARFCIVGTYLYVLDDRTMKVFDISKPLNPIQVATENAGFIIETIFPNGNQLFIGGMEGVYIYDISNPRQPRRLSLFQHTKACDPVVVQGQFAYVTLRAGTNCSPSRQSNQLDILDISNLSRPRLVKTHNTREPRGLAVLNEHLFLCDANELIAYQLLGNGEIRKLDQVMVDNAYDVMAFPGGLVIVVGRQGVYQYQFVNGKFQSLSQLAATGQPAPVPGNDGGGVRPNPSPNPRPNPRTPRLPRVPTPRPNPKPSPNPRPNPAPNPNPNPSPIPHLNGINGR
jgi:hypothetical protein